LVHTEILGYDLGRCGRHPVREEYGFVFGKVAVIEDEKKFASVRPQALNGMRNARRKKPQIVFLDVGDKTFAFQIDAGDAGISVQHEGPLGSGVPMQFAASAGGEAHVPRRQESWIQRVRVA